MSGRGSGGVGRGNPRKGPYSVKCSHCAGDHFLRDCPQIQCLRCLGYGHMAASCSSDQKCFKCGKDGHMSKDCGATRSNYYAPNGASSTRVSDSVSGAPPRVSASAGVATQQGVSVGSGLSYSRATTGSRSPTFKECLDTLMTSLCSRHVQSINPLFEKRVESKLQDLDRREEDFERFVVKQRADFDRERAKIESERIERESLREPLEGFFTHAKKLYDALNNKSKPSGNTDIRLPHVPISRSCTSGASAASASSTANSASGESTSVSSSETTSVTSPPIVHDTVANTSLDNTTSVSDGIRDKGSEHESMEEGELNEEQENLLLNGKSSC